MRPRRPSFSASLIRSSGVLPDAPEAVDTDALWLGRRICIGCLVVGSMDPSLGVARHRVMRCPQTWLLQPRCHGVATTYGISPGGAGLGGKSRQRNLAT